MDMQATCDRLSKLNLTGFKIGDQILFCRECAWQAPEPLAMKPICPDCGVSLMVAVVSQELVDMTIPKNV